MADAYARDTCSHCGAPCVFFEGMDVDPALGVVTLVPDGRSRAGRDYRRTPIMKDPWVCGACDKRNEPLP
jgi:hypothetical protein